MSSFLGYIGSKRRFAKKYDHLFPIEINNYYEPFLGGGSVFFHLKDKGQIKNKSFLNDHNKQLIQCFTVVRNRCAELTRHLDRMNNIRTKHGFHGIASTFVEHGYVERAASLIYLSKRSFNGQFFYTENGMKPRYSSDKCRKPIYNDATLLSASKALKTSQLSCMDYTDFIRKHHPRQGDFVFMDPPYLTPWCNLYYDKQITENDYREMYNVCEIMTLQGVRWMMTTNDCSFIRRLFRHYKIVNTNKGAYMKATRGEREKELIITNYTK
jgi:DNA adenine methylase